MIHAFVLVLILGGAEQRSQPMYFIDVDRCNYFASTFFSTCLVMFVS